MKRYQVALLFFALGIFSVASLLVFWAKRTDEQNLGFKIIQPKYNSIQVFFSNNLIDPQLLNCDITYPVRRNINLELNNEDSYIGELAYRAISELLKGPSEDEKNKGFFTSINEGVRVQKISIENNVATVDFDNKLNKQVAGLCKVQAIRSQITQTLKQFQEIKEVKISVNGESKEILRP